MKRNAFSMIELVFVIVILGVLAAVAVPKFVSSRADAQVATLRSDIATVLKTVPSRVFAENLDIGQAPTGNSSSGTAFTNWGDWIVDTAGLDKTKWKVSQNGIEPIYQFDSANPTNSQGCGAVITIVAAQGNTPPNITFDPDVLNTNNALCKGLKSKKKGGGLKWIPLNLDSNLPFLKV